MLLLHARFCVAHCRPSSLPRLTPWHLLLLRSLAARFLQLQPRAESQLGIGHQFSGNCDSCGSISLFFIFYLGRGELASAWRGEMNEALIVELKDGDFSRLITEVLAL